MAKPKSKKPAAEKISADLLKGRETHAVVGVPNAADNFIEKQRRNHGEGA